MHDLPAIVGAAGGRSPEITPKSPSLVYLASLAKGSRRTMINALNTIARLVTGDPTITHENIPWHDMRYPHTTAIRTTLNDQYAYATVNKMLAALRGTLKAAWKLGLMSADDYQAAASIRNITGHRLPAGRFVSHSEMSNLLRTCEDNPRGIRDRAIIILLLSCGLRRAELIGLNLDSYDVADGVLTIRGKRNKERSVPIPSKAVPTLDDWIAARGVQPGPLFIGIGNRNVGGRLTEQSIYGMLAKRAEMAEIPSFSPHDLRRTYVSNLFDAGVDISTVQKLAGHAHVETTARYDRRGEGVKRSAAEKLSIPDW